MRNFPIARLAGCLVAALAPLALAADDETTGAAAATESARAEAVKATDFTLTDLSGKEHTLSKYLAEGQTVVLEWFNPDCPVTRSYHLPEHRMTPIFAKYREKNVVWLAINSGAPGKQGAGLERNRGAAKEFEVTYPILLDESGTVGKAYGAKTTPHMFVIAPNGTILYDGAIDDSSGRGEAKTNFVDQTLGEYFASKPVSVAKTKAFGCSVKYAD